MWLRLWPDLKQTINHSAAEKQLKISLQEGFVQAKYLIVFLPETLP